jgi:hypothetical protein
MKGITKYFFCRADCGDAWMRKDRSYVAREEAPDAIEKRLKTDIKRINSSVEKFLWRRDGWIVRKQVCAEADVYKVINTEESNRLAQQIADEVTLVKTK